MLCAPRQSRDGSRADWAADLAAGATPRRHRRGLVWVPDSAADSAADSVGSTAQDVAVVVSVAGLVVAEAVEGAAADSVGLREEAIAATSMDLGHLRMRHPVLVAVGVAGLVAVWGVVEVVGIVMAGAHLTIGVTEVEMAADGAIETVKTATAAAAPTWSLLGESAMAGVTVGIVAAATSVPLEMIDATMNGGWTTGNAHMMAAATTRNGRNGSCAGIEKTLRHWYRFGI